MDGPELGMWIVLKWRKAKKKCGSRRASANEREQMTNYLSNAKVQFLPSPDCPRARSAPHGSSAPSLPRTSAAAMQSSVPPPHS